MNERKVRDNGCGTAASETSVALLGIIVRDEESVPRLNEILHEGRQYVIGRTGIPYRQKGVSIICVAVDGPIDAISALSGRLGMLSGVTSKTVFPKMED